jgi:hypothetical protein
MLKDGKGDEVGAKLSEVAEYCRELGESRPRLPETQA